MKKTLAALLVVCVVCAAGAAFAQGRSRRPEPGRQPMMNGPEFACRGPRGDFAPMPPRGPRGPEGMGPGDFGPCGRGCRPDFRGPEGRRMRFAPDMSAEIRAKVVELEKLRIDLDEAMTSRPLNKAKALEVYAKMQTIENELNKWRFEQKLERMEKFMAMKEAAPKPEAPAPEVKTEETNAQ